MPTCVNPLSSTKVVKHLVPAFKLVPNCSLADKPLLIYRQAFTNTASTADVERHLRSIGIVEPQWRYTMYPTDHFHSTSHEVLTIVSGRAKLCFGHMDSPDAVQEQAEAGDVIVIPAGVSHRLIEDLTGDFQMVGSYPVGCSWDMCYGSEEERAKIQGISELPWFSSDPVYGQDGPAMHVCLSRTFASFMPRSVANEATLKLELPAPNFEEASWASKDAIIADLLSCMGHQDCSPSGVEHAQAPGNGLMLTSSAVEHDDLRPHLHTGALSWPAADKSHNASFNIYTVVDGLYTSLSQHIRIQLSTHYNIPNDNMSKIITVFGATGAQGGSVVDAIIANKSLSQTYKIRGVTRDTTKPAAKELEAKGVELVKADMSHVESIQEAIRGSYAVFAVTNYWEHMSEETEVQHGRNVADASVKEKVHHLIWSSLPNVTKLTEGKLEKVEHFDGKAEVEDYITAISKTDLPVSTFFQPAFYMSNIKSMSFPGQDGAKTFAQPWNATETRVPLLDTRKDTGNFVAGILLSPEDKVHKMRVQGTSQWQTPQQIVDTVTEVTGEKLNFAQTTQEQTVQAMGSNKMAIELAENMVLIRDYSYYGKGSESDTAASQALCPEPTTSWAEFVKAHW